MIRVTLSVMLACLMLVVFPAFSDGPQKTEQPEFYFTRLMYTDIFNRGPRPGEGPPDLETLDRRKGYGDNATRILLFIKLHELAELIRTVDKTGVPDSF